MIYNSIEHAKFITGLTYLGKINNSLKHEKNIKYNEMVYTLYLAPAEMSGYNVCPMSTNECRTFCLNQSGRNRIDTKENRINKSRIKKTKLFFEHREFFMKWLIDEIKVAKAIATSLEYNFSVRLNNTSDISPEQFYLSVNGEKKNILEIFPDVQFYDYSKVEKRAELVKKYKNYDLTFSFNGYNLDTCMEMLKNNIRVAMVFKKVPSTFMGVNVINGDNYDMRYNDDKNSIIGLKFKIVRNKLTKNTKFVIQ